MATYHNPKQDCGATKQWKGDTEHSQRHPARISHCVEKACRNDKKCESKPHIPAECSGLIDSHRRALSTQQRRRPDANSVSATIPNAERLCRNRLSLIFRPTYYANDHRINKHNNINKRIGIRKSLHCSFPPLAVWSVSNIRRLFENDR